MAYPKHPSTTRNKIVNPTTISTATRSYMGLDEKDPIVIPAEKVTTRSYSAGKNKLSWKDIINNDIEIRKIIKMIFDTITAVSEKINKDGKLTGELLNCINSNINDSQVHIQRLNTILEEIKDKEGFVKTDDLEQFYVITDKHAHIHQQLLLNYGTLSSYLISYEVELNGVNEDFAKQLIQESPTTPVVEH